MEESENDSFFSADGSSSDDSIEYPESFTFSDDNTPEDYPKRSEGSEESRNVASSHRDIAVATGRTTNEESNDNYINIAVLESQNSDHERTMASTESELKNDIFTEDEKENYNPINLLSTDNDRYFKSSFPKIDGPSEEFWDCDNTAQNNFTMESTLRMVNDLLADEKSPGGENTLEVVRDILSNPKFPAYEQRSETSATNIDWNHNPINLLSTDNDRYFKSSSPKIDCPCEEFWDCDNTAQNNFTMESTLEMVSDILSNTKFPAYEQHSETSATNTDWSLLIRNTESYVVPDGFDIWISSLVKGIKIPSDLVLWKRISSDGMPVILETVTRTIKRLWVSLEEKQCNLYKQALNNLRSMETADPSTQRNNYAAACSTTEQSGSSVVATDDAGCSTGSVKLTRTSSAISEFSAAQSSKQTAPNTRDHGLVNGSGSVNVTEQSAHVANVFPPFVSALRMDKINDYCSYCFEVLHENKRKCPRCDCCCYCNEDCERKYARTHENECLLLRDVSGSPKPPSAFTRVLAHLVWKVKNEDISKIGDTVGNQIYRFNNIQPYRRELLDLQQYDASVTSHYDELQRFFGGNLELSEDQFKKLYERFFMYLMPIRDHEDCCLGIGMYLGLAAFDYSRPPDGHTFLNNRLEIFPPRDSSSEDKEERHKNTDEVINTVEKAKEIARALKAILHYGGRNPEGIYGHLSKLIAVLGCSNFLCIEILESVADSCNRLKFLDEAICCYRRLRTAYELAASDYSRPPDGHTSLNNRLGIFPPRDSSSEDKEERHKNTDKVINIVEKAKEIARELKALVQYSGRKPEGICGHLSKLITVLGCSNYLCIEILESVADSCNRLKFLDEAIYCYRRLRTAYEALFGDRDTMTLEIISQLGYHLLEAGESIEGREILLKASEKALSLVCTTILQNKSVTGSTPVRKNKKRKMHMG